MIYILVYLFLSLIVSLLVSQLLKQRIEQMAKRTLQEQIYDAVIERGYGPKEQGLTREQFAARQIAKMFEELLELAETVSIDGKTLDELLLGWYAGDVKRLAKEFFDKREIWTKAELAEREFIKELADSVPLFNAAEALGVSLLALCRDKAMRDIERGVRNDTTNHNTHG